MPRFFAILASCFIFVPMLAQAANAPVSAQHAWARATAQSVTSTAIYVTLKNEGATPLVVSGISSSIASDLQMHDMKMEGDVMKMRPMPNFTFAPGVTAEFAPGGMHIMVEGLKQPLKAGSAFPVTITFASGETASFDVTVKDSAPRHGGMDHMHMDHM